MSVQPVTEAPVVPEQQHEVLTVEPVAPGEAAVQRLDHITSHSIKCYWDFRECRWECSED
jgi:hypothetical protein